MTSTAFRVVVGLALPALAILSAHFAGVWVALGAHPFWSLSGAGIGLAIGSAGMLLILIASRFGRVSEWLLVLLFGCAAIVAAILMLNGKEGFAISYARDAVAGRFWHFGYIGFIAAFQAMLASALLALTVRR